METFIDTERGQYQVFFGQYPDGEWHVQIPNLDEIPNGCLIYHRLYPNPEIQLIKLFLVMGQLGTRNISVFTPYLPYSRQDKDKGAKTICSLLAKANCEGLYTLDCHFLKNAYQGRREGLNIYNFFAKPYLMKFINMIKTPIEIIAPDAGAAHLADHHFTKTREDGHIVSMKPNGHKLTWSAVALIDDMISSGDTMVRAANILKVEGAFKVYFLTTHLFMYDNAVEKLLDVGDGIFATDSICNDIHARVPVKEIYDTEIRKVWATNLRSNSF